jgi:hypothetical protein
MRVRIGALGVFVLLLVAAAVTSSAAAPAARHGLSTAGAGTSPSVGRATRPSLLREPYSSSFAVRPATVFIAGDGSSFVGRLSGKGGSIHWKSWTGHGARGIGTYWLNDFIPSAAQGTFHPHRAVITASRARNGHFTRMTVRFRGGGRVWDAGQQLYVESHSLKRFPPYGYVWS